MWRCNECNATFEEPKIIDDGQTPPYKVCPNPECEDEDIERTAPCEQCSEQKPDNLEKYCDHCKDEAYEDTGDLLDMAVLELKTRWDAELINWALGKWVENNT
jgi:hypothetical protein